MNGCSVAGEQALALIAPMGMPTVAPGAKVNRDLLYPATLQLPKSKRPSTVGVHNTGRVGQKASKRIDRIKRCPNTTRLTSF